MQLKEIAQVILERRQRMNPTVSQGEMSALLGSSGFAEAIERRWLTPCYETGYLEISGVDGIVREMREIAALPDAEPAPDLLKESRDISVMHARRNDAPLSEATFLSEIAAPATGKPSPGFAATASPIQAPPVMPAASQQPGAPAPATPSSPAGHAAGPAVVGETVSVVNNGKTYTGVVKSNTNGRIRLSFGGGEQPPDRDYAETEIQRVANAAR